MIITWPLNRKQNLIQTHRWVWWLGGGFSERGGEEWGIPIVEQLWRITLMSLNADIHANWFPWLQQSVNAFHYLISAALTTLTSPVQQIHDSKVLDLRTPSTITRSRQPTALGISLRLYCSIRIAKTTRQDVWRCQKCHVFSSMKSNFFYLFLWTAGFILAPRYRREYRHGDKGLYFVFWGKITCPPRRWRSNATTNKQIRK